MKKETVDCLLINHEDAHGSEYLAKIDERIEYISNFSGSNGLCLVTMKEAFLWTDSRYFLAAEQQLDKGWTLKKMGLGQQTYQQYLLQHCSADRIAYDSSLIMESTF